MAATKQIEKEIGREVNKARRKHKKGMLKFQLSLLKASRSHSYYMSRTNHIAHIQKNGSGPSDRVSKYDTFLLAIFGSSYIGENCFMMPSSKNRSAQSIAKTMVKGWMKSSGHRRNILDGQYSYSGIGVVYNKRRKKYYATQVFRGGFF